MSAPGVTPPIRARKCFASPTPSTTAAVQIWTPDQQIPEEFFAAAKDADWLVVAHNDGFESAIEERLLNPSYGWPLVPIGRHRCTMAAALANALPGALDAAAAALGLEMRKDPDGHRLMRQMSRPRKPAPRREPRRYLLARRPGTPFALAAILPARR